jgi:hypothetical protein
LAIFVAPNRADFINVPVTFVPSVPAGRRATDRKSWNRIETLMSSLPAAFSSEDDSGSHEENASKQEPHRFCETVRYSNRFEIER